MYLDPIETMKRPEPPLPASAPPSTTLKSENKYSVMENRESYIPSDETMKRFNVSNYHNSISQKNKDKNLIQKDKKKSLKTYFYVNESNSA